VCNLISDLESDRHTLLQRAEEVAQVGSWEWDVETDRVLWSDNMYRIFGLEPGEITPTPGYVLERTHVDDHDRVEQVLEAARRESHLAPLEYRIVRPDGAVRHLLAFQPEIEQARGRAHKLVGSVQDVTDWRRAELQIAAHVAVSESLERWETFDSGAAGLLCNVAGALDCLAGVLWVPLEDVLVARAFWHSRSIDASALQAEILDLRLRRGAGRAGRAWQTKEPMTHSDAGEEPKGRKNVRSLVAIPALHGEEVLAVLEFFSEPARSDFSDPKIRSLTGIGHELGQFLCHRRGELSPHLLTPRELQVLQAASQGLTAGQIAVQLFVSPSTVATHFKHIYAKYGVSDRASAVAKALRGGLIE
jgi:PAS domain S-box-containing protein